MDHEQGRVKPWQWHFNLCFPFGCKPRNLKLHHSKDRALFGCPPHNNTVQLAKDLYGVPASFFVTGTQQIVSCPRWFRVSMMFQDGRWFKGQSSITIYYVYYYCSQKIHFYWSALSHEKISNSEVVPLAKHQKSYSTNIFFSRWKL